MTGTSHQHSGCLRVSLVSSELWAQIVLSLRCCLSPSCTLVCAHMLCMRMIARSRDMCTCACVVCMQVYACVYCECMCTLRVCAHVHMWESECECWVGPGEMCLNGESWAHTFCLRPNHMEFHIFTHLARGNLPRLSQLKKKTPKSLSSLPLPSPLLLSIPLQAASPCTSISSVWRSRLPIRAPLTRGMGTSCTQLHSTPLPAKLSLLGLREQCPTCLGAPRAMSCWNRAPR